MIFNLTALDFAIVLPFIFLAGFIDSVAGGGGLISLPAYWTAGLPPHIALGTNKFSSCLGTIFSTRNYLKANMIDLPVALCSAVLALLGSWLGTRTVLIVSSSFLNYLLVVMIPVVTFVSLIRKDFGYQNKAYLISSSTRMLLGGLAGLTIGFYDGFFGPGTGTFLILFYALALHYDLMSANANTKVVNLASNIAALITFVVAGKVYYPLAIPAAACGIAGNIIGSKLVILKGNKLIKKIYIIALVLLFLRVVYNLIS